MARVHAAFVGCKVSRADSRAAAAALVQRGHATVDDAVDADVCIVVTCAVTGEAERKSRRLVRRLARSGRPVVVAGCAAALRGDQFAAPGVIVAAGGDAQTVLGAAVEAAARALEGAPDAEGAGVQVRAVVKAADDRGGRVAGRDAGESGSVAPRGRTRTRFTLKVQDGCAASCSYCTVRTARGDLWSLPIDEAAEAAAAALAGGCGEIVLSGINLGRYGTGQHGVDLAALVIRLCDVPGLERLRLSSIEPLDLTERLLDALAHPSVARHLHVPLQSADDAVLAAMRRPYDSAGYVAAVGAARARLGEDLALTTDAIIGFPAEDDGAYRRTLAAIAPPGDAAAIAGMPGLFSRVHVFRYSPRPGTAAAASGRLPAAVVARRMEGALSAAVAARRTAAVAWIGRRAEVLVEESGDGACKGYSSQYVRYYLSGEAKPGALVTAIAEGLHADGVKGRII